MRTDAELKFGRFQLQRRQRRLLMDGAPLELGGRAIDVLEALINAGGALVSKDELLSRVWPGMVVEEHNLTVQIHALRKALGDDRDLIRTVSRRGYAFEADALLTASPAVPEAAIAAPEPVAATNLPPPVDALVGRDDEVQELLDLQARCRLLTLTGPGGIGKTRLALEVARRLLPSFEDGVWLAELAPLSDAALVPVTIASAFGVQLTPPALPNEAIAAALAGKNFLLVLDNCEHVVADAARAAEMLLRATAGGRILATSREPLGAVGESVYRVPALAAPDAKTSDTDAILAHGAVQLFIARACAADTRFRAADTELPAIATICRRLDGIPLAIELAARRAPALGVGELLGGLANRLGLLTGGHRTALPRHQTLRATLDWSHDLLTETERKVLRRLGVFVGGFTLPAASAVVSDAGTTGISGVEAVADLLDKSLIVASQDGPEQRFRMLETTRAYALAKLQEAGEGDAIGRRHAEHYRNLFERAEGEAVVRPTAEWIADYAPEIDNLRAALDWAFSPGGDGSIGVALTAAAAPLWMYLSLIDECRVRVARALTALATAADADARLEMKLQSAFGASLAWVGGVVTEIELAWTKTLDLARRLDDVDHQLRALWGLWLIHDRQALALAQQFAAIASTPADRLISDQMIGFSYHFQGNQRSARRHLERVIANDATPDPGYRIIRFDLDQQTAGILARVLWLQGLADQALGMVERLVERAKADHHANSLCHTLAIAACPVVVWLGHLDRAEQYIELLLDTAGRHVLAPWHAVGRAHRGVLLIKRGDLWAGLPQLRAAFEECRAVPAGYRVLIFVADLAEAMGRAGQTSEALATVEQDLDRADRTAEGWVIPELLRVKGELLRMEGAPRSVDAAEACLKDALQLAGKQDALSWELRAATSLGRLLRDRGRSTDAIACLQPIYDRFTEGFGTADLMAAKQLLDDLGVAT